MNYVNEVTIKLTDGEGNYIEDTLFISGKNLSIVLNKIRKRLSQDLEEENLYKKRRETFLSRMLLSIATSAGRK